MTQKSSDNYTSIKVPLSHVIYRRDTEELIKKKEGVKSRRVLRCKVCGIVWNRDSNGAKNILKIAKYAVKGKDRPSYFCSANNS